MATQLISSKLSGQQDSGRNKLIINTLWGGVNSRFKFLFTFHLILRQLSATAQRSAESMLHIPLAILKRGECKYLCTSNTYNPNTQSTYYSITT